MGRRRKFTDEQEQEICRRYEVGENLAQLAEALGASTSAIAAAIRRQGGEVRTVSQAGRTFSDQQEAEICRRYRDGENTIHLEEAFGVNRSTIFRILSRNGVKTRSRKETQGGLSDSQEAEVCGRYLKGDSSPVLAKEMGVSSHAILSILGRHGIERRDCGGYGDSVQHALDATWHHTHLRECEFYLFELARYSDTHCKPGIAFNADVRVSVGSGKYGAEVLRLVFATRAEAYFLEQAVLDATRGSAECPADLLDWGGATEIRSMPASDMEPIVLRLADELEELGMWEFAARYVPMTAAQRATCQQRALVAQEVG